MKHLTETQLDEMLYSISNIKEQRAPDYFYSKLMLKMEKEIKDSILNMNFKFIHVLYMVTFFLFINHIIYKKILEQRDSNSSRHIEALASTYDQIISN